MTTTKNSLMFEDLFNETTLSQELRSATQFDLKEKVQIVKPVKTAEPPNRTTGKFTYKHIYAHTQYTYNDPNLQDKGKKKNYMSFNIADLNCVYNQIVTRFISVTTEEPPNSKTGIVTHKYVYTQTQCTCHDPKLWDKDKMKIICLSTQQI